MHRRLQKIFNLHFLPSALSSALSFTFLFAFLFAFLFVQYLFCASTSFAAAPSSSTTTLGGPESVAKSRYQSIVGVHGMVVSDDREASAWGAEILRQGGNAIDAAVATAFAMAVTRPHYASLGGGGFMIYCPHSQSGVPAKCHALDYREKTPGQVNASTYIRNGKGDTSLSTDGPLASGVPGVTAGLLLALEKFGTLNRQKVLKHPIEIAKKGYIFTPHSELAASGRWSAMNDAAKMIFGCHSRDHAAQKASPPMQPCPPGTVIHQPDLSRVLGTISTLGKKGFYEGWVGKKIVKGLQDAGGKMTLDDLKAYQPQFREVVSSHFEGHEIISMPPPSSGGVIVLQLLEYATRAQQSGEFDKGYGSAQSIHSIIHGMSLAFADRARYLGDPDFVEVPLQKLLSTSYLDGRWKTFKSSSAALPDQAGDVGVREPQHTTHFSVIDRHGNAVSITTTVNDNFGSGFVPPGTGIVMNDEMDDFSLQAGVPNMFGLVGSKANSVQSGKRPLSSMSPTIIRDSQGNTEIVIGAAGGPRIITSVYQSILNRIHFGMSLIDAVAAPRIHHQWSPKEVLIESFGFSPEVRTALEKKGYELHEVSTLGKVHAIERLSNGRTLGVADFRGEGAAVPE